MSNLFKNLLFKGLFCKNKNASASAKRFHPRRLELEKMEERITPATISVNGSNQVVLTLVTNENISSLHVDIVANTITITDKTNRDNTPLGTLTPGITVTKDTVVVDTTTFSGFAGLVVNAAPGATGCEVIVDSAGLDLSTAPGAINQSVSINLSLSTVTKLDVKSVIKTKGSGAVDLDAATIKIVPAGDITTNTGNVDITAATLIETEGDITTTGGNIFFNDNLTLTGDVVLSSGPGNVLFGFTVDGDHNLTVNSSGITTFNGLVGTTKALKSITTNAGGTTNINTNAITTTGNQTYNDAVTLSANTTLNAGVGNILFGSTLNGAFSLTLNGKSSGTTTFAGIVGGIGTALTSISVNAGGTTNINGGAITTTGFQTYSDAVVLGADTTLTGTTPTFSAGVTGAGHDLTLNFSGITAIDANFTGIKNLTTNAAGTTTLSGAITTTGTQIYNDAISLITDTILTGTTSVFSGGVTGANHDLTLNFGGTTTIGADFTGIKNLTTNASGTTSLSGAITTSGTQTFNDAVNLSANTSLNAGAGITFGGTLNGAFSLGLTAGTGAITFVGTVGNSADLTSLIVSSAADISIGAALKATGLVSFAGNSGVDVFLGTAGPGLSLTDAELDFITTTGGLSITASGIGVMVVNNVTGGGTITGITTLSAGGTGVSFATTSSNFNNALTVTSPAIVGVNISTSNDALTFSDTVKLNGNTVLNTGAGTILFSNTLNGTFSLNAISSSITTFGNIVGGVDALTSLTTNSGGTTLINGGAIITTGNQTYNDAITLGANTALTSGTGNIFFGNTITDGMSVFNLNLDAGAVGTITGTSLDINNLTIFNGASAAFTGAVTVNDLITTANPYSVSMIGTGNTFAQNVEFLNTGAVVLNGTPIDTSTFTGGLVVTAPSSITIQGTVAATNSNMVLGDADTGVILANNTTLNAGIGNINLDGTVSGAFSLTPITSSPGLTTIIGANTNITTNVTTGVVQINNSLPQTTNYSVSGGTLKGNGAIGNLNGTGTGIIAPGNSPGQITTKSLSLSPTNTIQIELEGTIPGTQYDQIVVGPSGTVVLGNAILSLSSTFAGSAGAVFVIIDNQSLSSVIGTFAGLPEGAVVSAGGQAYKISYAGGTGNDVTLTVLPTVTLNTSNLTITTPTLTITGTGFDTTPANNIVSFNNGAIGTVTSATSTQLTIDFSTLPTSTGSLTAIVTTNGQSSGTPVQVATIIPQPVPPLITGTPPLSSGGSSVVSLYDPITGEPSGTVVPFPGFTGEIRVISGDLNNDGKLDIIAAAGPGGGPAVVVLDSETGAVLQSFFAFDPAFTGGVFVAVRDFNGDGILDIIAGAGMGGGPEVRIFDGANLNIIRAFFAYDQNFTGGVRVAAVDFNADGILDIVTGAGPGGAPHVKVFDGATNSIISQWFAYPISFTGGVFVAAGDVDDDGSIELVTGAGMGGAPVVAVWDPLTGALISQFMAYAMEFSGGVRVGVSDGNGDGILDLITGAGPGGGPEVKGFSFPALDLLFSFYSGDPANSGGVFVS